MVMDNVLERFDYAQQLDREDELAEFRGRFVFDGSGLIYLNGHSLGRLPKASAERLQGTIEREWGERLIRGWNEGWFRMPERVGEKLAAVVGARPDEVIVADSTSVNLYKLVVAALQARPGRKKIVTDDLNFPSDLYVLQGAIQTAGGEHRLEMVSSAGSLLGPVEGLTAAIDGETALVVLSHTTFKSGYTYDMAAVTRLAQEAGALVLWDVSHSAGVMPVHLTEANADLAVGCTYKYLNGGPGAPAFLYVRRALQEELGNPISGWMGQKGLFEFGLAYEPAEGLRRFLTGTPAVLSLAGLEPAVELVLEAGIERVRAKSVRQSEYLIALWEALLAPLGFRLNSPRAAEVRGSHVSLGHDEGFRIARCLIEEMNVLPDFRAPDNIRFGISPLYNSFGDIYAAVDRLRRVVAEGLYEKYSGERPVVT
jgi:kynureninase